jgi:hypothetical protein
MAWLWLQCIMQKMFLRMCAANSRMCEEACDHVDKGDQNARNCRQ